MANLLRIKRIDEVSLVDKGASGNDHIKPAIVIAKRRDAAMKVDKKQIDAIVKILKSQGYTVEKKDEPTMTIDEVLNTLTEDQKVVVLAALQATAGKAPAAEPMEPKEAPPVEGEGEGEPKEKKPMPMAMKRADLPEDVRKQLDEADALKKRFDKMVEEQEAAEFLAKASDLKYLAGASTAEIAKAMRAAKKSMDAKEYETFAKLLANANEAVRTSKMFAAPGVGGDAGGDDATSKIDAIAKSLVTAGKAKDYKEALRKAMRENPEVYAEYKAELQDRSRSH